MPYPKRQSFLARSTGFRWLVSLGLLGLIAVYCWGGEKDRLFKQARKAEKAGKYVEAYLLYSQARALEPTRERNILAAEGVRGRAAQELAVQVIGVNSFEFPGQPSGVDREIIGQLPSGVCVATRKSIPRLISGRSAV